ncbi:MAG TPA: haloalkane dehalogenase [Acidimicrobiales bacterium]
MADATQDLHHVAVLDSTMAHREVGTGAPFVLLHGNPSSSYAWRAVLPVVGRVGRALAPDLIGMGASGKPDIGYGFADTARYLDAWFDALGLDDVVLVGHDWGGALALDHAARHPGRVRGVALMETILKPMTWADFPGPGRPRYEALRASGTGEAKVLDENFFIEQALRATVRTGLSDEDLDVYRAPYPTRESRRPLLAWPRAMPIEGEPADVVARVEAYDAWMARPGQAPKLLLTFDGTPDTLLVGPDVVAWCRQHVADLEIEACGPAAHMVTEDQPAAIAAAVVAWAGRHGLAGARG